MLAVFVPMTLGFGLLSAAPTAAAEGATTRVSLTGGGGQSSGNAVAPSLSSDGSRVVFTSDATDLTADELPVGRRQLFVRDMVNDSTQLVSVSTSGEAASTGAAGTYDTSGDGRFVVFASTAENLVDRSGLGGDFLGRACTEQRFNPAPPGGGTVYTVSVYCSDIFLRDTVSGTTTRLSVTPDGRNADGHSYHPRVSDDGRRVVFTSTAANLVPGDGIASMDVFLYDADAARITRITNDEPAETTGDAAISADGSTVAFFSTSGTLDATVEYGQNIYVHDVATATSTVLPVGPSRSSGPTLSGDGSRVAFSSSTALVGDDPDYTQDVYLYDRTNGALTLMSRNGERKLDTADRIEVSDDGRFALFRGRGGLVDGTDPDKSYVYVRGIDTGRITIANVSDSGAEPDSWGADTGYRSITADGSVVAFSDRASNLVDGDTNNTEDVFLRSMTTAPPPGSLEAILDGAGGEFSTGTVPTTEVPVVTAITAPAGVVGELSVAMQPTGDVSAPSGYDFFGWELVIHGPPSTPDVPYVVTFTVDDALLGGVAPADVQVFRNGTPVADCTDPSVAAPDPCVAGRADSAGDAVITVRTSAFSTWGFGKLTYEFTGPLVPLHAAPAVNSVRAGAAAPVRFGLGGDRGLDVLAAGYPVVAPCDGSRGGSRTATAGASSLTYSTGTGVYAYVWKSPRTLTGCRDLVLRFRDGTEVTVRFDLR